MVDTGLLVDAAVFELAKRSPSNSAALRSELRALKTTHSVEVLASVLGERISVTAPIVLAEAGWVSRPKVERRNGRQFLEALDHVCTSWNLELASPSIRLDRQLVTDRGYTDATLVALVATRLHLKQEPELLTIDGPLARWCAENDVPCTLFETLLGELR